MRTRFWSLAATAVGLAVLAVSCTRSGDASVTQDYRILPSDSVTRMHLQPIGTITLGTTLEDSPEQVSDIVLRNRRIYVVDTRHRRLELYDVTQTGDSARLIRFNSDHELSAPERAMFTGDSIIVADAGHTGALEVFDADGKYLGGLALGGLSAPAGTAIVGRTFGVAWVGPIGPAAHNQWFATLTGNHTSARNACPADRRYSETDQMAAGFAVSDIWTDGATFFCTQTISPVIIAFDTLGHTLGHTAVAPPFYRAPPAVRRSQRVGDTRKFLSQWTPHVRSFALGRGFLSVYSEYDSRRGTSTYMLFGCRDWRRDAACATASVGGEPVALIGRDSLLVVQPPKGSAPITIEVDRVTGFPL